jgi:hypothetical protein
MAIIQSTTNPPSLTTAQKKAKAVSAIQQHATHAFRDQVAMYNKLYAIRNSNADGLSASDVDAALGATDAAAFAHLLILLKSAINYAVAGTITDGTGTATITMPS